MPPGVDPRRSRRRPGGAVEHRTDGRRECGQGAVADPWQLTPEIRAVSRYRRRTSLPRPTGRPGADHAGCEHRSHRSSCARSSTSARSPGGRDRLGEVFASPRNKIDPSGGRRPRGTVSEPGCRTQMLRSCITDIWPAWDPGAFMSKVSGNCREVSCGRLMRKDSSLMRRWCMR